MREIKAAFPIFRRHPHIYLDTAATAHKPQIVIDRVQKTYGESYGSVHRGLYGLSNQATATFEQARRKVQCFLNADRPEEIVFTSGTTAAINMVALGLSHELDPGDNVVISEMEHHANFIPWQQLARQCHAELRIMPINIRGDIDLERGLMLIDDRTRMVAVTHLSNVLGTVNPIQEIIAAAHAAGAKTLIDAAQSVAQIHIDVQDLDCDYLAFSGHKIYGPTGIGILYGKQSALEQLCPSNFGGGMVGKVSIEDSNFRDLPQRLEAGSQHLVGAAGLEKAIEFVEEIGIENINEHSTMMIQCLRDLLEAEGMMILGDPAQRLGCISFELEKIHPHDVATVLGQANVCVRAGHHCAQPLMNALRTSSAIRASIGIYNDENDLEGLVRALRDVKKKFL